MRVDLGQRKMYFAVNNAKYREMTTIRQSDSSYYLAVAADYEDSQITLTKFYIENPDDDSKTKENEVVVKQKSIEPSSPKQSEQPIHSVDSSNSSIVVCPYYVVDRSTSLILVCCRRTIKY